MHNHEIDPTKHHELVCPYCESKNSIHRVKPPHHRCRRCGTTWNINGTVQTAVDIRGPKDRGKGRK